MNAQALSKPPIKTSDPHVKKLSGFAGSLQHCEIYRVERYRMERYRVERCGSDLFWLVHGTVRAVSVFVSNGSTRKGFALCFFAVLGERCSSGSVSVPEV